jgi:hypothetical protein
MDRTRCCSGCKKEKPAIQFLRLETKLPGEDITNLGIVSAYIERTSPKFLKTCDLCAARVKAPNKARNDRATGRRLARRVMQEENVEMCDLLQLVDALRGNRGDDLPDMYSTPSVLFRFV